MEKILKKVDELAAILEKAIEKEDKRSIANDEREKSLDGVAVLLDEKAKDINLREEAVKPIEDVAAFRATADETMREAKKKMRITLKEQDEADKKNLINRQEFAEQKKRIASEDARILDEKEGLKRGYAQLKQAEEKSENKVLKNIVNKVVK